MAGEWKDLTLDDLGRVVTGKTPLTSVEGNFGGRIPFVTPSDMDGRKTISTTARFLTQAGAASVKGSVIPAGAIMVSCIGSDMGKVVVAGCECVTNQQINSIVVDDRFSSEFVYYSLSTRKDEIRHQAAGGSAVPILNKGDFSRMEIALPPFAEQKAIAAVLGALDDKIELNRRMNATLEAMARALFQSWFVDFDPVRAKLDGRPPAALDPATAALFPDSFQDSTFGHIPKGWESGSILRQADLLSGGTPKTDVAAYWNGDVPWASAKDVSQCGEAFLVCTERTITKQGVDESSTKIIPANATVVVARGATTGRLTMFGHAMAINQTCYGLRSKVGVPFALYCNARHFIERLVQGGHGSIFDTITTSTFEATDVLLAPKEVLLAFDKQVTPLFQQVHANLHQSRTLATLRDTLLPKLLSGELSVAGVERTVEPST